MVCCNVTIALHHFLLTSMRMLVAGALGLVFKLPAFGSCGRVYFEFGMISSIFVLQVLIHLVFSCSGLSLERCVLCDPIYTPQPQTPLHQSVVMMMIPALGDCLFCRASFYLSSSNKNVGKSSGFSNYCMI